jgi:hypothetical protein
LDLQADKFEDAGGVDVVFDVIGGEILDHSTALVRASGMLVTIARMPTVQPNDGRAIFFVVEPDRSRLADLAQRLRDGRLKPIVGAVARSPKRLLRLPRTGALPERRSSGSSKADSRSHPAASLIAGSDARLGTATQVAHGGRRAWTPTPIHFDDRQSGRSKRRTEVVSTVRDHNRPVPLGFGVGLKKRHPVRGRPRRSK